MIPLLPVNDHFALSRELGQVRNRKRPQWPDDTAFASRESRELRPDPTYFVLSRAWAKMTDLLFGGFRKTA